MNGENKQLSRMVKHREKSRSGEKQIEFGCGLEGGTCSGIFEDSSLAPLLVSLEAGLIPQPHLCHRGGIPKQAATAARWMPPSELNSHK